MDLTAVTVAVIGALASIAAAVVAAVATARSAGRNAETAERTALHQVEADAYKRARETYEGAMARMESELERQARELDVLHRQMARGTRRRRAAGLVRWAMRKPSEGRSG
ncbi:hypothetical protein [Nonomuraea sp. NPDC050786]|uniref:hypothetical protein n=1 Tax=Nonomuraea sp. NPDC050786 TaxID=3154840 RepID=UPI003408C124